LVLPGDAILTEKLDRPVAGAVQADFAVSHDPEAILEAYLRPRVEAKQIAGQRAKVASQRLGKTVRNANRAPEARHSEVGRLMRV
jgi:hypothetical protein